MSFLGNLKDYIYLAFIAILGIILLFQTCGDTDNSEQINKLKEKIVKKDSLLQVKRGEYTKLVNNFNSEKQLNKKLKNTNQDLHSTIKSKKEKILSLTQMVASLRNQVDTVSIKVDTSEGGDVDTTFTDYYPNEDDWFTKYQGNVINNCTKIESEWSWSTIKFDMTVTETEDGLWRQRIKGPDFLQIDSLSVNTLDPSKINQEENRKLYGVVGGGPVYNWQTKNLNFKINGGIRHQRNQFMLGVSSSQEGEFIYLREF